jgi:hypothetical protein
VFWSIDTPYDFVLTVFLNAPRHAFPTGRRIQHLKVFYLLMRPCSIVCAYVCIFAVFPGRIHRVSMAPIAMNQGMSLSSHVSLVMVFSRWKRILCNRSLRIEFLGSP